MTEALGFPAFPAGSRRRHHTWWGSAWIQSMEDTAVDSGLTRRGRRVAGDGRLGPITVSPGRVAALVDGTHQTTVTVEALSANAWTTLVAEASVQSGHLAALLDGYLPHALSDLLPTVGELDAQCSCDDWGNPCQHAAALCYQTTWLLDADPTLLLLLRHRTIDALTTAIAHHHAQLPNAQLPNALSPDSLPLGARPPNVSPPTTLAAEAFSRPTPPLPDPPPPATEPPRLLTIETPPGIDPGPLYGAAATAITRARHLLSPDNLRESRSATHRM